MFRKILIIMVVVFMPYTAFAKENTENCDGDRTYILMDGSSGKILLENNSEVLMPVSGLTRMMSLLIVFEEINKGNLSLDEKIVVSQKASNMGGTQVFLRANKSYIVDDLIKSVIIASANDSIYALCERVCIDYDTFIQKMNDKAKELGLNNTCFTNVTGFYDEKQTTTAKDMALLSKELLEHDLFYKYSNIYLDEFVHPDGDITEMINANKMIRFYDGADGITTGSSTESGYCLAATAKKGNSRFIYVSLGEKNSKERFSNCTNAFNYGYNTFTSKRIVKENQIVKKNLAVKNGEKKTINLYASDDLSVIVEKGNEKSLKTVVEIYEDIEAPIAKGQKCGKISIKIDGKTIGEVDLVSGTQVSERTFTFMFSKYLNSWIFN